ncbi:hypothetical protein BD414DRAFT_184578 [Trametes punicea]|nr:hypothetical protein BD414DRAFT_184578 [Trametes punicea]
MDDQLTAESGSEGLRTQSLTLMRVCGQSGIQSRTETSAAAGGSFGRTCTGRGRGGPCMKRASVTEDGAAAKFACHGCRKRSEARARSDTGQRSDSVGRWRHVISGGAIGGTARAGRRRGEWSGEDGLEGARISRYQSVARRVCSSLCQGGAEMGRLQRSSAQKSAKHAHWPCSRAGRGRQCQCAGTVVIVSWNGRAQRTLFWAEQSRAGVVVTVTVHAHTHKRRCGRSAGSPIG